LEVGDRGGEVVAGHGELAERALDAGEQWAVGGGVLLEDLEGVLEGDAAHPKGTLVTVEIK